MLQEIFFTGQLDPGGDSGARLIHMKSSKVQKLFRIRHTVVIWVSFTNLCPETPKPGCNKLSSFLVQFKSVLCGAVGKIRFS